MEIETISSKLYNLVGDIGATNARFALVSPGSSEMESIKSLKCSDFEDIQSAILLYLSDHPDLEIQAACFATCLLYTSPSPRDRSLSRMPSSA